MEPFFSGVALGLLILIPLVFLMFAAQLLILAGAFVYGFVAAAHASWVRSRNSATAEGSVAAQVTSVAAEAWLARARQRRRACNEQQLAWMDRHWATAWYARFYRRIFHYPPRSTVESKL